MQTLALMSQWFPILENQVLKCLSEANQFGLGSNSGHYAQQMATHITCRFTLDVTSAATVNLLAHE